ncbi:threonylcarbamoyl-AMP synthase [Patescibacteria group bacterium]|nr:threonylcarbamoyl-AMP synthase [Patescibacteria group bacterium]
MKILKLNSNREAVINEAKKCLENDGLLIYPTETVYGIGANASSEKAIDKLLKYKGRRQGKPLSIAVSDQEMASKYVDINEQALKFYKNFLPGPFTVISKSKNVVDSRVNSEFGTLGIRIPNYSLVADIIKNFGQAITSTSANASGKKRPYKIADILDNLSKQQKSLIDLVIDAGELPKNEPSTVIDTTLSTPIALRGSLHQKNGEILYSDSEEETIELAGRLMLNQLNLLEKKGLVFALNGPLGMGKTIFAKGVGKFLGIREVINSPTYSYINEYDYQRLQSKGVFYHVDAWKIDLEEEVALLEIEKLVKENNVVVIEWFEQIEKWLDLDKKKLVTLNFSEENGQRKIQIGNNA